MTSALQLPFFETAVAAPRREPVDVHALSIPARTFTGDFYFVRRTPDSFGFVVGDVAGKGLGAAVFMAMIQEQLDAFAPRCRFFASDPSRVAAELDVVLRSVLPANRFATAVIASIDRDGLLHVANAGHCPLLVARRDGSVETISSTGPLLGMIDGARWSSTRVTLVDGDAILAYSDGVIEASGDDGEEYGLARLTAAFSAIARHEDDARQIALAIERDVRAFARKYDDDMTIVSARWKSPVRA